MRSFMKTLSKTTLPRIDNEAHPIRHQIFGWLLFGAAALFCMSIAQAAETSGRIGGLEALFARANANTGAARTNILRQDQRR